MPRSGGTLDSVAARLVSGLIAAVCTALLVFLAWDYFVPPPNSSGDDETLNPQFIACRDARLGAVRKMKTEGIINERQFSEFSERAVATCAGQFPPGQGAE